MRLAIIGGGAAAVSLLDSALRRFEGDDLHLDITVYEGSPHLATGRAYREDLDCALVNREAGFMSIRREDRGHFLRWLHREPRYRDTPYARLPVESYAPRHLFGAYLHAQLARIQQEATLRGWNLTVVHGYATRVVPTEDEVLVHHVGGVRSADRVVLCLGTGEPTDPYRLAGAPGFHPDPYPLRTVLPALSDSAHVLVLGTGLSAVDVALGLLRLSHRGRITMVSRHGLLPGVRARHRPADPLHLTPENVARRAARHGALRLRDVGELVDAELPDFWSQPGLRQEPAAERLRRELSLIDHHPAQAVVTTAMHQVRERVWSALTDADKRVFLRRFHPLLKPLYNPMPPPTARRLLAAMDEGQLRVVPGVTAVAARPGGRYAVSCGDAEEIPAVDAVIDATRAGLAAPSTSARPLLSSLVASGAALRNPFGGLRIDTDTNAVLPAWEDGPRRLFALGDIASGDLYYASSMFMINTRADRITAALAAQLSPDAVAG